MNIYKIIKISLLGIATMAVVFLLSIFLNNNKNELSHNNHKKISHNNSFCNDNNNCNCENCSHICECNYNNIVLVKNISEDIKKINNIKFGIILGYIAGPKDIYIKFYHPPD